MKADVELTRRVMTNLVENAVTHGGKQTIAIEWRVSRAAGGVDVVVSDDGAGVSAEDLPGSSSLSSGRIGPARASTAGSGAGLGLSIVQQDHAGPGRIRACRRQVRPAASK